MRPRMLLCMLVAYGLGRCAGRPEPPPDPPVPQGIPTCRLLVNFTEVPFVDTRVLFAEPANGRVLLAAGAVSGLERRHQLTIFRDQTFVARVVVDEVGPLWSWARVLYTAGSGDRVRPGDGAATRLD